MDRSGMRFSIGLGPYERWPDVDALIEVAVAADRLGYFGALLPEHVVMPVKQGLEPINTVWYDNFVLASHLAALTRRLRFVFSVMVVPYRPPLQMAKLVSTLDVVSRGRLVCGVGTGWMRREFRALGISFEDRGARTDEYLRAMRALWTQERPAFEGRYTSFRDLIFEPKCWQKPHVPIWIGGSGPRAIRRVAELGDGWVPMVGEPDELARDIARCREAAAAAGRDPDALDFSFSLLAGEPDPRAEQARRHVTRDRTTPRPQGRSAAELRDRVAELGSAGFNHLSVSWSWSLPAEYRQRMEWFAREVASAFAG